MKRDASVWYAGGTFLAAGLMLWLGWMLMPSHIGTYFETGDFAEVHSSWTAWIWTYRFHLFGHVISVLALIALGALLSGSKARPMIWSGIGVASAGIFVTALAHAFYYHFGAWGALEMHGKPAAEVAAYTASLTLDTEYVTCLTRFGRVFSGVGLVVLGAGLFIGRILPRWIAGLGALVGLASIALTMILPDDLHLYMPIFQAKVLWLLGMGVIILRSGLGAEFASAPEGSRPMERSTESAGARTAIGSRS